MKIGDRILDPFLGVGTVVSFVKNLNAAMILFDETPPCDYNCGANPCLRFLAEVHELIDVEAQP